jgi:hypothetical protein
MFRHSRVFTGGETDGQTHGETNRRILAAFVPNAPKTKHEYEAT